MTKTSEKEMTSRRDFLKVAGTAPVAAAVAVAGTEATAAEAGTATGGGLRDTAHIRTYYETARF